MTVEPTGVWMGVRACGCPVAVCTVAPDLPKKWVEQAKREYLKQGYQVVYASWSEWLTAWSPKFVKHCEHNPAPAKTPKAEQGTLL